MMTIRKRISRPYLAIIILMPITILVLFNLIVAFYTQKQAETNLTQAVASISAELNGQEQTESNLPNVNKPNIAFPNRVQKDGITTTPNKNSSNLISIINGQSYANAAELVVFNASGELSKIFNTDSFITNELATMIYEKSENLNSDSIGKVKFENDTYYVMEVDYDGSVMTDKMVYITKGLIIDEFVTAINLVLIIVSLLITLIALFISTRVTNAVAKPIERLTSLVENMKIDEILVIDDNSDSIELQKLTSEINALNKRIYHYDKSQKNFLHNASHELRTPLMSIQGYADGIEMGVFEDYKGTAHLISDQSKRLTKLVEGLLKLARAENFSTNKKLEKLNLSDSLLELVNGYNGYAVSQNIVISTEITPKIFVNSNTELLQGSVGNMISNAIRYAKSTIIVSLQQVEDKVIITVRDDGNGIEDIDKIFDRFSKGEDGNFGLGLSIAKTSIEMMNGEVKVYNDNGAVFEVVLLLI